MITESEKLNDLNKLPYESIKKVKVGDTVEITSDLNISAMPDGTIELIAESYTVESLKFDRSMSSWSDCIHAYCSCRWFIKLKGIDFDFCLNEIRVIRGA